MLLIDTNIYSDAMRGLNYAIEILRNSDKVLMSPIVIGELLSGFKIGERESKNRSQLEQFLSKPSVLKISINEETSLKYSLIFSQLKKAGTPIPSNDIWIAASALEHKVKLASKDKHFRYIKGLLLYS